MVQAGSLVSVLTVLWLCAACQAVRIDTVSGVVTIIGEQNGDEAGFSVAGVGDVNGDGFGELLIGAPGATADGRQEAGKAYLIFGSDSLPSTIQLPPDPNEGVTFLGAADFDRAGQSVARAGDINGDGNADFLIGAPGADPSGRTDAGRAYLVFGTSTLPDEVDLSSFIALTNISGANAEDQAGFWVAPAGDIDEDGLDDVLIGAPNAQMDDGTRVGKAYLIYGSTDLRLFVDLSNLAGEGTQFIGVESGEQAGASVTGLGDVNRDGDFDILIGAPGGDVDSLQDAGASYLVFGGGQRFGASFDLADLTGSSGLVFENIDNALASSGQFVSAAGDVDGDKFPDFLISAPGVQVGEVAGAGAAFLIFGRSQFPDSAGTLSVDNPVDVVFTGTGINDMTGHSVAGVGFFNNDRFADLLIGAFDADVDGDDSAGKAFLVLGDDNLSGVIELQEGASGVTVLEGEAAGDQFGASVNSAGDVDGDRSSDIIIGAPAARGGNGAAYLLFGEPATSFQLQLDGPDFIVQQNQGTFAASLVLSNGFTENVTNDANWAVTPSTVATVSTPGVVQALQVSSDQQATVTVSFEFEGETLTAEKQIDVIAQAPSPKSCFPSAAVLALMGVAAVRSLRN